MSFGDSPFLAYRNGELRGPGSPTNRNAWGAYVENTSAKKAEQYLDIYKKYMPVNNPEFLGSLVFYWGQKQELTPLPGLVYLMKDGRQTEDC